MNEDRPSSKRILITVVVVVIVAAALLLAAWATIGLLAPKPAGVLRRDRVPARPPLAAQARLGSTTSRVSSLVTSTASSTKNLAGAAPRAVASTSPEKSVLGVVAIDPGHGGKADSRQEPIGPGAAQTRPREPGGASGVVSGIPESQLNLAVSLKLRAELVRRGVKVVMVRTRQNVDISPRERAEFANKAHADLLLRIHADSANSQSQHGLKTLVPTRNQWTGPIYAESLKAGQIAQRHLIQATGATDLGIVKRNDLGGFNWSHVPTYLVEMGFMSNPAEDRKMETAAYQAKIVKALADAVAEYLRP
jgi:N-acetylmuramoyl-L-alanine amidase